jgi:DNA-binding transcriptional LysR family regulator
VIDPRTDLRSLQAFYHAFKQGSFRKAGDTLHLSQPAITQRVDRLEECLGGQLLDERRRQLTPLGETICGYAERILRLHREMLAQAGDPAMLCGTLNLGVAETIVHTWLPAFLQQMHAAFPRLALVLDVDISAVLKERLLAQQLDLAFLVGPVDEEDLHRRPLNRERLGFVASPRLGLPPTTTLAAIARHPLITFPRNTRPFKNLRDLFTGMEERPLIHACASVAAIVRMTMQGLGVAVLPRSIVQREVASAQLTEIECGAPLSDLELFVSWHTSPRVGHLEDLAQAAVAVAAGHQKGACTEPNP